MGLPSTDRHGGYTSWAGPRVRPRVDQRRATPNSVKTSRSGRKIAGARDWAPRGAKPNGLKDIGIGDRTACGDRRFQLSGRSLVIHVLWNGFLLVLFAGAADREVAGAARLIVDGRPATRATVGAAGMPTVGAAVGAVQAGGSGRAAAAHAGRNADPATSAMNTPSAAATAMAGCHRRVSSPPRKITVHRM